LGLSKNEVASLAIGRSMAPLANQMEGKMPEPLKRSHIKREAAQARAYSQAVITEGGRTIWLAGQVAIEDSSGRSLAADFDGQVREVFARLGRTLEEAGASLADLVTMTVFITDARLGDRFTQLRREIFADNFPASALITVAGLARPGCWSRCKVSRSQGEPASKSPWAPAHDPQEPFPATPAEGQLDHKAVIRARLLVMLTTGSRQLGKKRLCFLR